MASPFNTDKIPPAPILDIRLSSPGDPASGNLHQALVDTGSDFTLVPLRYLLTINAPETRSAYVRGLFSNRQLVTLYLVDVHTEIGVLSGFEVIGLDDMEEDFDDREIIIGRNILNRLYLFLNGPDEETHLLEQVPRRF